MWQVPGSTAKYHVCTYVIDFSTRVLTVYQPAPEVERLEFVVAGMRGWCVRCPGCRRQVPVMYLPTDGPWSGRFRCARCHDLGRRGTQRQRPWKTMRALRRGEELPPTRRKLERARMVLEALAAGPPRDGHDKREGRPKPPFEELMGWDDVPGERGVLPG